MRLRLVLGCLLAIGASASTAQAKKHKHSTTPAPVAQPDPSPAPAAPPAPATTPDVPPPVAEPAPAPVAPPAPASSVGVAPPVVAPSQTAGAPPPPARANLNLPPGGGAPITAAGPPKKGGGGPPPQYMPPWLDGLKELEFPWGHFGYSLNYVKGWWHASERWPMDRGLHIAFGPDDRFLLIFNYQIAIRFTEEHSGTKELGRSFDIERMVLNFRGNIISPNLNYMINLIALSAFGNSPFLLDALFRWEFLSPKNRNKPGSSLELIVGQFPADIIPEANTTTGHLQLADRTLATRFFFIDRAQGAQVAWTHLINTPGPLTPPQVIVMEAGVFNHTIEQGSFSFNQYNPDLRFMYMFGINYFRGSFGSREGDFPDSKKLRFRAWLHGYYADIDSLQLPGQRTRNGRIIFANAQLGWKYHGWSLITAGFFRLEQFVDVNPQILDFGMHAQMGIFLKKKVLELTARYSQVFPDTQFKGPARDLPRFSLLTPTVDYFSPLVPYSTMEAGGGLRLFPNKDPMFNIVAAYLWRNVDSSFLLQVNGWL